MDDIEFSYIGEEDTLDDDNLNEDFEVRTVRVNKDGKKLRGKDLNWTKKCNYNNPKTFEDSNCLMNRRKIIGSREEGSMSMPLSIIMFVNILREKNFCRVEKKSELCFLPTVWRFLCKNAINMNILKTLTLLTKA